MKPVDFEQSNIRIKPPKDMEGVSPEDLPAFFGHDENGTPVVMTCWKLNPDEVNQLLTGGKIWLGIAGTRIPPLKMTTRNPFN